MPQHIVIAKLHTLPPLSQYKTWLLLGLSLFVWLGLNTPAHAHFGHNYGKGIWYVQPENGGFWVYTRQPMGLAIVNAKTTGMLPAKQYPFSHPDPTNPELYTVAPDKVVNAADRLAKIVAANMQIGVNALGQNRPGDTVTPTWHALRVYPVESAPPFKTFTDAKASLAGAAVMPPADPTYVGDSVVDVLLYYPYRDDIRTLRLQDRFDASLRANYAVQLYVGLEQTNNQYLTRYGPLNGPAMLLDVDDIAYQSFASFVSSGITHIFGGLDHLLLVMLLTLAAAATATQWRRLFAAITGFTLGHSVSLLLGAYGIQPNFAGFIPLVEVAIAITIAWVALQLLRKKTMGTGFIATSFIGLIHGYGFAAMFTGLSSDNIWLSWLGFNLGIEIGQLIIVLITLLLSWLLSRVTIGQHRSGQFFLNCLVSCLAIAISLYWIVDRTLATIN